MGGRDSTHYLAVRRSEQQKEPASQKGIGKDQQPRLLSGTGEMAQWLRLVVNIDAILEVLSSIPSNHMGSDALFWCV